MCVGLCLLKALQPRQASIKCKCMSSPLKRHLVDTFSGLHCRLLDWRPDKLPDERFQSEKTVVLKNVFDPSEFDVSISPG